MIIKTLPGRTYNQHTEVCVWERGKDFLFHECQRPWSILIVAIYNTCSDVLKNLYVWSAFVATCKALSASKHLFVYFIATITKCYVTS